MSPRDRAATSPGRAPVETPPAGWRDPWLWASLIALVPVVLFSRGAPLGEPAADDWDFVTYALFGRFSFFDGGGSAAFWRPLPHQVYYALVAPSLIVRPWLVPALHALVLIATTVLLYRLLRVRMPGSWAAVAASFPLLAESARMSLQWTGLMIELAFILFTVLALHEATFGRMPSALLALLASLLSKEIAVVTALALPFMPRRATNRRRWIVATAAVTLVWALVYIAVRRAHDLHLPHGFEYERATVGVSWIARYYWTVWNAVRAMFSLPVAFVDRALPAMLALVAILAAAVAIHVRRPDARRRLAAVTPVVYAGLAWFALTLAPLVLVYPMWMPHRAAIAAIGLGAAFAAFLGAAHPGLLAALVALRLGLFALSPAAPARVAMAPRSTGAFLDFEKLARLQLLMRDTRSALMSRYPTLPHGARIVLLHPPLLAEYAYGGNQALEVWYRDSTLQWSRYDDLRLHREWTPHAVLDFEPSETPQVRFVEPEAMRLYLEAEARLDTRDWPTCLGALDSAEALQRDLGALAFRSRLAGRRALVMGGLGRGASAEREALRALTLWRDCADARFTLASLFAYTGQRAAARRQLDTLLSLYPGDRASLVLRDTLDAWARAGRR